MVFLYPLRTYVLLTSVCLQPASQTKKMYPFAFSHLESLWFHLFLQYSSTLWRSLRASGVLVRVLVGYSNRPVNLDTFGWENQNCTCFHLGLRHNVHPLASFKGSVSYMDFVLEGYRRLWPWKLSCWPHILPFSTPCYPRRPTVFCLRHFAQEPPVATCQAAAPLVARPLLLQPASRGFRVRGYVLALLGFKKIRTEWHARGAWPILSKRISNIIYTHCVFQNSILQNGRMKWCLWIELRSQGSLPSEWGLAPSCPEAKSKASHIYIYIHIVYVYSRRQKYGEKKVLIFVS